MRWSSVGETGEGGRREAIYVARDMDLCAQIEIALSPKACLHLFGSEGVSNHG